MNSISNKLLEDIFVCTKNRMSYEDVYVILVSITYC